MTSLCGHHLLSFTSSHVLEIVIGLIDVWLQEVLMWLVWLYIVNRDMLFNWFGACVVSGKCRCEIGYGSADCSVKYHEPPFKVGLPLYGLCDRQFMKCDTVIVYGTNFVNSDKLKCHLRKCQVTRALCSLCQHCTWPVSGNYRCVMSQYPVLCVMSQCPVLCVMS